MTDHEGPFESQSLVPDFVMQENFRPEPGQVDSYGEQADKFLFENSERPTDYMRFAVRREFRRASQAFDYLRTSQGTDPIDIKKHMDYADFFRERLLRILAGEPLE